MIAEEYRSMSVAEWLHKNQSLAGFENPTKMAFTSIRELVENSLDSCELARVTPRIFVEVKSLDSMYEVKVTDNGKGVPRKYLANAFGRVLFSSKYVNKQTRGTMGAGGKLTLIMSQVQTRKPFTVASAVPGSSKIYGYVMEIDIKRNQPVIHKSFEITNKTGWHGVILKFYSKADFKRALNTIKEYLKLTNVICPYASITFKFNGETAYEFTSVSSVLPKLPKVAKLHPHGVDAETLQYMINSNDKEMLLSEFLIKNFQRVGRIIADKFLRYANFKDVKIGSLNRSDVSRLAECMKSFDKFLKPDDKCLSPIGEGLFRQGAFVSFNPEFFCYSMRKGVYLGHPYVIEVAVCYGGKIIRKMKEKHKDNVVLLRFANRIPLLYDSSSCAFKKVLDNINLSAYRINNDEPILVLSHICSTKVPYKTVGKEFIASEYKEINHTIRLCYGDVFRRVRDFIGRKKRYEYNVKRVNVLKKYLEYIVHFTSSVLNKPKVSVEELIK